MSDRDAILDAPRDPPDERPALKVESIPRDGMILRDPEGSGQAYAVAREPAEAPDWVPPDERSR